MEDFKKLVVKLTETPFDYIRRATLAESEMILKNASIYNSGSGDGDVILARNGDTYLIGRSPSSVRDFDSFIIIDVSKSKK